MSTHFNDPNFDSRKFDPLKPKVTKGMNFEEHQRIVAAGLKMMGGKTKLESDINVLFNSANAKIKIVKAYAELIDKEVRAAGGEHNRSQFASEIMGKYLDAMHCYTQEELLFILCEKLTRLTLAEIV